MNRKLEDRPSWTSPGPPSSYPHTHTQQIHSHAKTSSTSHILILFAGMLALPFSLCLFGSRHIKCKEETNTQPLQVSCVHTTCCTKRMEMCLQRASTVHPMFQRVVFSPPPHMRAYSGVTDWSHRGVIITILLYSPPTDTLSRRLVVTMAGETMTSCKCVFFLLLHAYISFIF